MKNILICGAFIMASFTATATYADEPTNLFDLIRSHFKAQDQQPGKSENSYHAVQDGVFRGAFDKYSNRDDDKPSVGHDNGGSGDYRDALGGLFNK